MNLKLAVVIAFIVGFVSISMEIIWFSIIGYLFKGHAGIFGVVLSLVLFGIAFGARIAPSRHVIQCRHESGETHFQYYSGGRCNQFHRVSTHRMVNDNS